MLTGYCLLVTAICVQPRWEWVVPAQVQVYHYSSCRGKSHGEQINIHRSGLPLLALNFAVPLLTPLSLMPRSVVECKPPHKVDWWTSSIIIETGIKRLFLK